MRYDLDINAATRVGTAPRITETGAYVGKIYDAFQYQTKGGATMVRIEFIADDERRASLDMCILKRDGSDAFGINIFHALLACCHMRSTTTQPDQVYLFGQKQKVERFKDMLGKPVGLLLQKVTDLSREKYQDSLQIATPFDPVSRQTAKELLEKAEAKMLDKLIASTKDRVTGSRSNPAVEQFESPESQTPADSSSSFGDDIPF